MSRQTLRRLDGGLYAISDSEMVIVCTETTSLGSPELIGLAFATRSAGWRILRYGLADIGYCPDPETAIQRILDDAAKHRPRVGVPETVKKAAGLCVAAIVASVLLMGPALAQADDNIMNRCGVGGSKCVDGGTELHPSIEFLRSQPVTEPVDTRSAPGEQHPGIAPRAEAPQDDNVLNRCGVGGSKCVPK